jgi:hypothetical protein
MNAGDMFVTQSLQFRHMTRRTSRFIERQIYEHNHSEEAVAQSDARHDGQHDRQASIQAIIGSEVIPPVKPELFLERKEFGICDRSAAFRHHRSDFCVAGFRSRGCAEPISAAHRKLSASTKILSRPIAQGHGVNVTATATTQDATVVCTEEERRKLIELRERLLAERAH